MDGASLLPWSIDEHDHEEKHGEGILLGEIARLDTCITVVDAAEFYNNLDSIKVCIWHLHLFGHLKVAYSRKET